MPGIIYQTFTSTGLISLGLYHLTTTIFHHFKSPTTFSSKPYYPLSFSTRHLFHHLPVFLISFSLLISALHHLFSAASPDPLLPAHSFSSVHSAAISLLFLVIAFSLLLPNLPHDISFASASAAFYLLSAADSSLAAVDTSGLESHLLSLSSRVSLISSILSLTLAISPRIVVADVALSGSVILQGLWALQTGLSLYVDAFIPEGCHKLLDVFGGVDGSTKCEIAESRLRAVAILDLMLCVYVFVVVVVVFAVYAIVAKVTGISIRRFGSYEALPNAVVVDDGHVMLKTLSGTQA